MITVAIFLRTLEEHYPEIKTKLDTNTSSSDGVGQKPVTVNLSHTLWGVFRNTAKGGTVEVSVGLFSDFSVVHYSKSTGEKVLIRVHGSDPASPAASPLISDVTQGQEADERWSTI